MIRKCEHGAALHFLRRQTSHELELQSQVPTHGNRSVSELSSAERIGMLAAGISMQPYEYPCGYAISSRTPTLRMRHIRFTSMENTKG